MNIDPENKNTIEKNKYFFQSKTIITLKFFRVNSLVISN
jgi:hypothetical protein